MTLAVVLLLLVIAALVVVLGLLLWGADTRAIDGMEN